MCMYICVNRKDDEYNDTMIRRQEINQFRFSSTGFDDEQKKT